jgi:hypothetical protein
MKSSILRRLADLEGPPPRMKSKGQIFCERCTTPELEELCYIAEKRESGEALTSEEEQYLETRLIKYNWSEIPEEGEVWDFEADRIRLQRIFEEDHA